MNVRRLLAVFAIVPLVLSFVPGLPGHGYGHVWFALPLLFWWRRPEQRRRIALYVAGIAIQVLAFPDPDFGFLGWVLLWPYLLARESNDGANWWRAAYLYGYLRAHVGFVWLGHIHYLAWWGVSLGSPILFVIFFEGFVRRFRTIPFALRVSIGWLLFEWTHAWFMGGFPWLYAGHTQYAYPVMIQSADVWGAYGVSFVVVYVQAAAFGAWRGRSPRAEWIAAAVLFAANLGYGLLRSAPAEADGPGVLLVQTAYPHAVKERAAYEEGWRGRMLREMLALSEEGLAKHPDAALVVWPETMHPWPHIAKGARPDFETAAAFVAQRLRRPVVYGAIHFPDLEEAKAGRGFNSAILVDHDGRVAGHYGKQRLVPMGEEFLPRRLFPEWGDAWYAWLVENLGYPRTCNLVRGEGWVALEAGPGLRAAPLVCFEGLYAHMARSAVRELEPDFLLHLVNNGWFGKSWEERQSVASWVFRAVETRTPFVSCANAGVSCIIGPDGRIVADLDRVMETGVVYARLPSRRPAPLFVRGGWWLFAGALALAALLCHGWAQRRRKKGAGGGGIVTDGRD